MAKVTICHKPTGDIKDNRTLRVAEEEAVELLQQPGFENSSCDLTSGIDSRIYFPEALVDLDLNEEVLDEIQYCIDQNPHKDIRDKYIDFDSLSKELLDALLHEYGYDYITDVLNLSDTEFRNFTKFINVVHFLKGTKAGLELILRLISEGFFIIEWWEFEQGNIAQWALFGLVCDPTFRTNSKQAGFMTASIEPDTYVLRVFFDEAKIKADTFERLEIFLRNYVYPLPIKIDFRVLFTEDFEGEILEDFNTVINTTEDEVFEGNLLFDECALITNTLNHTTNNLNTVCTVDTVIDVPASVTEVTKQVPIFGANTTGITNGTFQIDTTIENIPEQTSIQVDVTTTEDLTPTFSFTTEPFQGQAAVQVDQVVVVITPEQMISEQIAVPPGEYTNSTSLLTNTIGVTNGIFTVQTEITTIPEVTETNDVISTVWIPDVPNAPIEFLLTNTPGHNTNNIEHDFTQTVIVDVPASQIQSQCFGGVGEYTNSVNLLTSFPVTGFDTVVTDTIVVEEESHLECNCVQNSLPKDRFTWNLVQPGFGFLTIIDKLIKDELDDSRNVIAPIVAGSATGLIIRTNRLDNFIGDQLFQTYNPAYDLLDEFVEINSELTTPQPLEELLTQLDEEMAESLTDRTNVCYTNTDGDHFNNVDVDFVESVVVDVPEQMVPVVSFSPSGQHTNTNNLLTNILGVTNPPLETVTDIITIPEETSIVITPNVMASVTPCFLTGVPVVTIQEEDRGFVLDETLNEIHDSILNNFSTTLFVTNSPEYLLNVNNLQTFTSRYFRTDTITEFDGMGNPINIISVPID